MSWEQRAKRTGRIRRSRIRSRSRCKRSSGSASVQSQQSSQSKAKQSRAEHSSADQLRSGQLLAAEAGRKVMGSLVPPVLVQWPLSHVVRVPPCAGGMRRRPTPTSSTSGDDQGRISQSPVSGQQPLDITSGSTTTGACSPFISPASPVDRQRWTLMRSDSLAIFLTPSDARGKGKATTSGHSVCELAAQRQKSIEFSLRVVPEKVAQAVPMLCVDVQICGE